MNTARRLMFSSSPPGVEWESCEVADPGANQILVRNRCTQVSAGSEANFLRFGPLSYGLPEGTPRANIGYMATGQIVAVGSAVRGFAVGDRVITGSPHASHSLVEVSPGVALDPIPAEVSDEIAGFASLGDVALHGVRRAGLQIDQLIAGEPEWRKQREREQTGIPIPVPLWEKLAAWAGKLNVPTPSSSSGLR